MSAVCAHARELRRRRELQAENEQLRNQLITVLRVVLARGEWLNRSYADDDYRQMYHELTGHHWGDEQ